jgi:hypothetical protein
MFVNGSSPKRHVQTGNLHYNELEEAKLRNDLSLANVLYYGRLIRITNKGLLMRPPYKLSALLILLAALALPVLMAQAQTATPSPAPVTTFVPTPTPLPMATPTPTEAPVTTIPGGTQVDTAIEVGDTVQGELGDDALTHRYTFNGQQGDVVTITLTSEDFDSFLSLLDEEGVVLTTNDDGAGNLNSRIDSFVLPADGDYTIEASSFSRFSTGSYTLSIVEGSAPTTTTGDVVAQSGGSIDIGDTVTGTLDSSTLTSRYTFEGEAGQVITITLTSEDFDTYLRLQDPTGFELAYDDDSAGNLDSRIGPYTLPDNGMYTIVVESFGGSSSGSYRLSLSIAQLSQIEYTQTVEDSFTEGSFSALYNFRGQQGDVITISMNSNDFDSYLTLSQSGQTSFPLITDDDSGGNLNSLIGPYTLPSTGNYIITASSLGGTSIGNYTLRLNRVELETLEIGDTVEAEIGENTSALYYSFAGTSGQVISIEVDSDGTLDTTLVVRGPDGYQAGFDDDSGGNYDPEINRLALTQTGSYIIVVQPYTVGDTGELTLELTESILRSLDEGPQQVRLNDKQYEEYFSFTGNAGERLRFILTISGGVASPNIVVNQNGAQIGSANGTSVSSLIFEVEVPADGDGLVQINDYSYSSVVFDIEMERLSDE